MQTNVFYTLDQGELMRMADTNTPCIYSTVCPKNLVYFHKTRRFIRMNKTSWTYNKSLAGSPDTLKYCENKNLQEQIFCV